MSTVSKLTVVGAGAVGSSVACAATIRGVARHIAQYDIAEEKTRAEVLDLAHGAKLVGATEISGGSDIAVTAGSDVVVITAGAKQKPGQTRLELAATNARIIGSLMEDLVAVSPDAIYVIVSNPCDVLTMLAQEASGLPAERIFASGTTLDTSRLRWEIGRRGTRLRLERARDDRRRARRHRVPDVVQRQHRHGPAGGVDHGRAAPLRPGDPRPDRRGRARRRLRRHPGQGGDELRDRPVEHADRRGDPQRRERRAARRAGALRHPWTGRGGAVGALRGQPFRRPPHRPDPVVRARGRAAPPLGGIPPGGRRGPARLSRGGPAGLSRGDGRLTGWTLREAPTPEAASRGRRLSHWPVLCGPRAAP